MNRVGLDLFLVWFLFSLSFSRSTLFGSVFFLPLHFSATFPAPLNLTAYVLSEEAVYSLLWVLSVCCWWCEAVHPLPAGFELAFRLEGETSFVCTGGNVFIEVFWC